ncbi:hypothetical protein [Streptomyces sp. S.PNR 29]|uniref:hypothetical protein n=1 Tax=Streptomyces sp. S.PNR 29 TaxID=2973805 RepID=UPI0025B19D66|nr:hypothetical protein [Streptomyces sp. S.PNR 29]MDN0193600.1 hypothetical protein [Streptomyces sp. S.PNR 29]
MNLAPQVHTAQISDADLDDIAGGQAGASPAGLGTAAGFYVEAGPVGIGGGVGAGVSPEGVAADAHLHAASF